jgi:hypothetical protein
MRDNVRFRPIADIRQLEDKVMDEQEKKSFTALSEAV